ncbi:outer membrane beta-barrel protein HofF [Helicobacter pylori]|uniref:outer membrane beta-barrel protein HofF n=1 Tax=Helicobacter pylori TaxID=210 RepID=UPI00026A0515|nr:outer membrane beta-barrel protein HofF [Helicobacter pylori]EJB65206.1 outer membrane protein HofF [Helicobacter pylori Hp H-44]
MNYKVASARNIATLLFLFSSQSEAFDLGKIAKIKAGAESFSKVGFNNKPINTDKGIYPTETFMTIMAYMQVDFTELLPKSATANGHHLDGSLGGWGGAVIYDSTKDFINEVTGKPYGAMAWNYVGYWGGLVGQKPWATCGLATGNLTQGQYDKMTQAEMTQLSNQEALAASTCAKTYADHTRNYVIYNAYLRYNYKDIFQIRGGRYESPADYMSGYNQGLDMTLNLGNFKFWWFSSFGRGFAYNEWLYNFYSPKTYTLKNGQTINPGVHAFYIIWNYKGFSIQPFVYFSPFNEYDPNFTITYDSNPTFTGLGFRSQTDVTVLNPFYAKRFWDTYQFGMPAGKNAHSLMIKQKFEWNEYNFGFGIYKSFGNANWMIGYHGNRLGFDFWTNTVYANTLNSLSYMMDANAFTVFAFGGGVHRKLLWGLLGRLTYGPRANEQVLSLNLGYKFTKNFSADIKFEYYNVLMHQGYKMGWNGPKLDSQPATDQDRSHIFTEIVWKL